jgi:hypothetical protein
MISARGSLRGAEALTSLWCVARPTGAHRGCYKVLCGHPGCRFSCARDGVCVCVGSIGGRDVVLGRESRHAPCPAPPPPFPQPPPQVGVQEAVYKHKHAFPYVPLPSDAAAVEETKDDDAVEGGAWGVPAQYVRPVLANAPRLRFPLLHPATNGSRVCAGGWCGVVWCGVVWCGVVWCGVVWCGVVWCGVVWCGVVWCGLTAGEVSASAAVTPAVATGASPTRPKGKPSLEVFEVVQVCAACVCVWRGDRPLRHEEVELPSLQRNDAPARSAAARLAAVLPPPPLPTRRARMKSRVFFCASRTLRLCHPLCPPQRHVGEGYFRVASQALWEMGTLILARNGLRDHVR